MEPRTQRKPAAPSGFEDSVLVSEAMRTVQSRYVAPVPPKKPALLADKRTDDLAPLPRGATSMLEMLSASIFDEVVLPILRGRTRRACVRTFGAKWHDFCETLRALHVVVARISSEEKARILAERESEFWADSIRRAAFELQGEKAEGEVDFALSTYAGAVRLVCDFDTCRELTPEELDQDRQIAQRFNGAAALHTLGLLMILTAAEARAGAPGVALGFEFIRGGAMQAYVAARDGFDLRNTTDADESDVDLSDDDDDLIDPLYLDAPPASAG